MMRPTARSKYARVLPPFLALVLISSNLPAQNEWVLQPWIQFYGASSGQELGRSVRGITPSSNLSFRATVSSVGSTGIYSLSTPSDVIPQMTIVGEDVLQGDLNSDGYSDIVMTKTTDSWDTVLVYWGNQSGLDTLNVLKIPGEAQFDGFRAKAIGDVTNDGFVDLICSAPSYPSMLGYGKVYIFPGPDFSTIVTDTLVGHGASDRLGANCVVGDLNADGLVDLAVRGWHSPPFGGTYDYVSIYLGSDAPISGKDPDLIFIGYALTSPGLAILDLNGDDIDDLAWTNRDSVSGLDYVDVHYGGPLFGPDPSLRIQDPGVANFGYCLENGGDLNGDGYYDLAVGAPHGTNTSGFVFVYGGGPSTDPWYDAAVGQSTDSRFGASISSVFDINGDGLSDLIVGAPDYDFGSKKGYWGIFLGSDQISVTSVERSAYQAPGTFRLLGNFPNPFNGQTIVTFELLEAANVSLRVYDLRGREVAILLDGVDLPRSIHSILFDGASIAGGFYVYELKVISADLQTITESRSMILLK